MHVAFVYMGAESLGVEYLSAVAKRAGHTTALFFDPALFSGGLMHDSAALARRFDLRPKLISALIAAKPSVAAFSAFTGNYQWALSVAREVKRLAPNIRTLFGGVHVTSVPMRVLAEDIVDFIIAGEADNLFPQLLEKIEKGETPNGMPGVGWKNNGECMMQPPGPLVDNLDALPFPDKPLFYDKVPVLEEQYMIMTARGCPFACTYCYRSLGIGCGQGTRPVRRRSVANIVEELRGVRERKVTRLITFRDDVFTLERQWLRDFTEAYRREIALPYFCYTHPTALDEEKADLIRDGGCRYVTMGVQAVDEALRREVLNRRYRNEDVVRTVRLLRERRIWVSIDHILGIPGDTPEHLRAAAYFYNELRPQRLLPFQLTYYPGTAIMQIGMKYGDLNEEDVHRIESGYSGHRYSGGTTETSKRLLPFATVFALIPLMPKCIVNLLLGFHFERILPRSATLTNMLLALCAVVRLDPFFFYNIRFAFSKKRVP
jgi:anaerobic magnesium-protoporphyrin IX monomethyl ester cyclase